MNTNDATWATAEGLPAFNRRRFLLNTTMAGAAVAIAAPAAAGPEMTARDRALWHMHELERLALEDGAGAVAVAVIGRPAAWHGRGSYAKLKALMIDHHGALYDGDEMFVSKGGAK